MTTWTNGYAPPSASVFGAQERALRDSLAAERDMRARAETIIRDFSAFLEELAARYDGQRYEDLRRANPSGSSSWLAADWREFFDQVPHRAPGAQWGDDKRDAQIAALKREIASLQRLLLKKEAADAPAATQNGAQNAAVEKLEPLPPAPAVKTTSPQQARGKRKAKPRKRSPETVAKVKARIEALGAPETVPDGMTGSLASLLADLQAAQADKRFPKEPPAAWKRRLDGRGRKGGDLALAYQRYWSVLRLIGRWGLVAKMEIETLVGLSNGLSSRSGALSRVMKDLSDAGVVIEKASRLSAAPSSALKLFQLSADGAALYKLLFEQDAVPDELSVMYAKHEGERFPDHTLAVLIFALHARRRGWMTRLMPVVEGPAAPDLLVQRGDERFYVEVERGQKENDSKWTGVARLNDGVVALCAMTPKYRRRLTGDCKLLKIKHGLATDLKTLVMVKYDTIGAETPLWEQKW